MKRKNADRAHDIEREHKLKDDLHDSDPARDVIG